MRSAAALYAVAVLCLARHLYVVGGAGSATDDGKKGGDDDGVTTSKKLVDVCDDDIDEYCPTDRGKGGLVILYCLQRNKSRLSTDCQSFLGTTTMGGCNDEATTLCGVETDLDGIYDCLDSNVDALSDDCMNNVMSRKNEESPFASMKGRSKHITRAITAISILYLLIPLLAGMLSLRKMYLLNKLQAKVLLDHTAVADDNKKDTENTYDDDNNKKDTHGLATPPSSPSPNSGDSAGSGSSSTPLASVEPWQITFHNISYWVSHLKSCRNPLQYEKKQILREVNGSFSPGTITAIMGPSGSGKTTLLKLLCGQVRSGEFSGSRVVRCTRDGRSLGGSGAYDRAMRMQGYVSQQENLLDGLTVWQTIVFASMLRMAEDTTSEEKLAYALSVMDSMGLTSIAGTVIGSSSSSNGDNGISGGQRRRLSIALELLAHPSTLMLDEPTSGLDAASSLRLVNLLQRMSRKLGTTVVLTIHQPRAEVFNLFDSLLLLGSGGYQVYSGPTAAAAQHLASSPSVMLSLADYDNPGDFIIDVLGLGESRKDDREASGWLLSGAQGIEMVPLCPPDLECASLLEGEAPPPYSRGSTARSPGLLGEELMQELHAHFTASEPYQDLVAQVSKAGASPGGIASSGSSPAAPLSQMWLLFARRVTLCAPRSARAWLAPLLEVLLVSSVVTVGFSYEVDTSVEMPYQVVMLFFMISTYAMILQYLILIPEYMAERRVLLAERASGLVGFVPYVTSAMLAEVPRAVAQSCLLVAVLYSVHPQLNDDPTNVCFCAVCLMVGVCAWQSLICVCAVATDDPGVAYTISFLALGSGSLFGGLMIRLSKIPYPFKLFYYSSVVAVTQRALVVNDLQCCYMTATCNSLAAELADDSSQSTRYSKWLSAHNGSSGSGAAFCPAGLRLSGDGSDEGNLGRAYLRGLGLDQDNPFAALLFLFWANIVFRVCAVALLLFREYWNNKLKYVEAPSDQRSVVE